MQVKDKRSRSDKTRHIEALADWLVETVNRINDAHKGEAPIGMEKVRTPAPQGGPNASQPIQ